MATEPSWYCTHCGMQDIPPGEVHYCNGKNWLAAHPHYAETVDGHEVVYFCLECHLGFSNKEALLAHNMIAHPPTSSLKVCKKCGQGLSDLYPHDCSQMFILPPPFDERTVVDPDIAAMIPDGTTVFIGHLTVLQLIKELRLTRTALLDLRESLVKTRGA